MKKIEITIVIPVFNSSQNLKNLVEEIFAYPKALICNVFIDSDFRVTPQVKFGRPNEDMGPLLPREMFNANMIIDPIN